ncbi:YqhR family membrane protein [Paenibacillus yanchengensis]|uniref:YqhR family membrane protein n=1 Tax=Paenibacillus yanchengensis TaxID=2035833 RepID=A0ABW4YK77_9BACL
MAKQSTSSQTTKPFRYALFIGFYAGLIWGFVRWGAYGLKFTKEIPGYWLEPFFRNSFLKSGWGGLVGVGSFIIFSIIAALIYQYGLRKLKGPWVGIFYGFLWWVLVFGFLGPLLQMTTPLQSVGWITIFTELGISLLWGVFIGYSISFEFNDEASREPTPKRK